MATFVSAEPITKPKKYIFVNGVMKYNPQYELYEKQLSSPSAPTTTATTTSTHHQPSNPATAPLLIISNFNDLQSAVNESGTPVEIPLPESTMNSIQLMSSDSFVNEIAPTDQTLFDGLCEYFVIYEVPIGMIAKLTLLRNYRLNLMVDDSGSMGSSTDVTYGETTVHVKHGHDEKSHITRWEGHNINILLQLSLQSIIEAENRIHIMIDILAYIPTKSIVISFMNNTEVKLNLIHYGKTPQQFQVEYHSLVSETFHRLRLGSTPTMRTLRNGFEEASHHTEPTCHYLFTDGVPSDSTIDQLKSYINSRTHPERNPLTLISCTNEDSECEWMKEIEEVAPFTSEVDDYHDEKEEVLRDQGPAFPYTKGLWIICSLVSAICPQDLDALDENIPFTKHTLDEVLGRIHTEEEYRHYWNNNPHAKNYEHEYSKFLNTPSTAREVVPGTVPLSRRKSQKCVVM